MLARRAVLSGFAATLACRDSWARAPSDEEVRAVLQGRIGSDKDTGVVALISDPAGTRVMASGSSGTGRPLDGDAVFEIGSITKVLTALLLADMAQRGEVAFSDPLTKHLPAGTKVREWINRITLLDLVTYTSGLPNWPFGFKFAAANHDNPLADYTPERVYATLPFYSLMYRPGTHYQYANLGFGLLGLALANRAGRDYESLLLDRICKPLNLVSTRITLTDDMRTRLAQGHDFDSKPVPLWDLPGLAGAGAVRSTANDLAVFMEACLGQRQTSLQKSIAMLTEMRRPTGVSGTVVGLGWFISTDHEKEMVYKNGATGGYRSSIAYFPASRRGIIVLSNTLAYDGLELSRQALDPDFQLKGIDRLF